MKPFAPILLAFALFAGPVHARIPEPPQDISDIPVRLLVDIGSGQVLHAHQARKQFLPASLTKVMTAYVAFQEMDEGRLEPDRIFTVRPESAQLWKGRGTSMYLDAGERVSTHDLLRGIMTASANDAAVVLAEGYAGSVSAWTFLMNDAARRLHMSDSHFATPNGWPDHGQTRLSARDLVRLAGAMIVNYPEYYHSFSGKKRMVWKDVALFSHDPITGSVPGADGIKTGFTREAGYNFLGSAQRGGRRLVMVLGGARSEDRRANASRAFLEWGFAQWSARPLFDSGTVIGKARVQGGQSRSIGLVAANRVYAAIPADGSESVSLRFSYMGPLKAPVRKGERVGDLEIRVGQGSPGRIPLYAAQEVKSASVMDRLINGFMSLFS